MTAFGTCNRFCGTGCLRWRSLTSLLFLNTVGCKAVDVTVVSNCSGKNPLPSLNAGNELHFQGIICSQHTQLISEIFIFVPCIAIQMLYFYFTLFVPQVGQLPRINALRLPTDALVYQS